MAAVLLVTKTPLADRLAAGDLDRLRASGAVDSTRLRAAADHHRQALEATRAALAGDRVVERSVESVRAEDAAGVELVVTVGGDGTVFTANHLGAAVPYLTVNSDPASSIGHFARARGDTVAALLARWRAGEARIEEVPRLRARVGGRWWEVLNDCLFSSENPAAMTKYLLEIPGDTPGEIHREQQRSSGVWVATAAGSTAAIHSAGEPPVPAHLPALLFRVREAFQGQSHGQQPATLLRGAQLPPRWLKLTPATPGLALYIDGPNLTVPLGAGATVVFEASPVPFKLVT